MSHLITVTRNGNKLEASGDLEYVRRMDPCMVEGRIVHTLEAGWRWTGDGLEVIGDRLGIIPIFYTFRHSSLTISDALAALVAATSSTTWDVDALAVFLRLHFFLGDDTPFEGVHLVAPGTHRTVTPDAFTLPRSGEPPRQAEASISRPEAIERYIELFRQAVACRSWGRRIGLPLSGGRDSRHILLELARSGRGPALALTFSAEGGTDDESMVAATLCRQLGIRHELVQDAGWSAVRHQYEKNRATHYLTDEHAWYLQVAARLRAEDVDLMYDGIAGDVLSNGVFFSERLLDAFEGGSPRPIADAIMRGDRPITFLSREWQRLLSTERALARIEQEAVLHLRQPNPVSSFYFWNRTRRAVGPSPVCLVSGCEVGLPYLEPSLLSLFTALPAKDYGTGIPRRGDTDSLPQGGRDSLWMLKGELSRCAGKAAAARPGCLRVMLPACHPPGPCEPPLRATAAAACPRNPGCHHRRVVVAMDRAPGRTAHAGAGT